MAPALTLSSQHPNGFVHPKKTADGFGTRAVHVGSAANEETGAVIPPISLSTTYKQAAIGVHKVRGPENTVDDLIHNSQGFEYSRSGNPNRNALESTLASLESGGA